MTHCIYTDGACSGNPGKGAWAFALIENQAVTYAAHGLAAQTTNNQMELTAIIEALHYIVTTKGANQTVTIHTDSSYCLHAMTEWVHGWKKRGWKKANGHPIENQALIETLYTLCYASTLDVHWVKVKAHLPTTHPAYDPFNAYVDALATKNL